MSNLIQTNGSENGNLMESKNNRLNKIEKPLRYFYFCMFSKTISFKSSQNIIFKKVERKLLKTKIVNLLYFVINI